MNDTFWSSYPTWLKAVLGKENWSFWLDLKIICVTVGLSVWKGGTLIRK